MGIVVVQGRWMLLLLLMPGTVEEGVVVVDWLVVWWGLWPWELRPCVHATKAERIEMVVG